MTDTPVDPNLNIYALLPIRSMVITLEAVGESHQSFFHQHALTAYLKFLCGSPDNYARYIRIDVPESGRAHYIAGDYYRFMLIGLNGCEEILDHLLGQLAKLPYSAPKKGGSLPFRDNWRLVNVQDCFTEASVENLADLSLYTPEHLQLEAELWHSTSTLHWQWLTPARLLKEKQQREGLKYEARYCRDSIDLTGQLLFNRVHDAFASLLSDRGEQTVTRGAAPELPASHSYLFWIDAEYTGQKGKVTRMGGMTGSLDLSICTPLSPAWWQLLVLAQYTGIGQNTSFGMGRYCLCSITGEFTYRRPLPASSLLTQAGRPQNLRKAWRHVVSDVDVTEIDDMEWLDAGSSELEDALPEVPLQRLHKDLDLLMSGKYKVPPMYGKLQPKKQGGVRALAIPPTYDRVLQRAVNQALGPALEGLMHRHSHGFRPGHSRITARYDIQAAWRAGYRWVYESDIKDFFASVNLQRLHDRLRALYGNDPIAHAIMGWMSAPVRFQGELIERKQGIPQGSPLSPLMANLMLDDFDNDMQQAGFHMIRFADDFVVLCKDPGHAKAAGLAAMRSLQEHGLDLHKGKTRITTMEDGFNYLGYLFVNDMALDISGAKKAKENLPLEVHTHPWAAELSEREPSHLKQKADLINIMERLESGASIPVGERDNERTLLSVTGDPARITTLNKQIQVVRKDKILYRLPWSSVQAVLVFGNHQITTQAMHAALRQNVAIHLCNASGMYQGVIGSNRSQQGHLLWLNQLAAFSDPDKALYCAREVVKARLTGMKENLRHRKQAHDVTQIDNAIRHAAKADNLDTLRGLEGSATKEYYQRIAIILPAEFGFNGRNKRPPRDPFNVLLSIGYTVLYGYTESILHSTGLLPRQGFYHQARGTHAALASDLMEPFRYIVERTAMTLVLRREIKPEDFSRSPNGACLIANEARRKYLSLLLTRWEVSIRGRGEVKAEKYFIHLHRQALSLKGFVQNGEPFKAWRLH